MFCEKCGAEIAEDSRFCEKCGAKIENISVNTEKSESTETVENVPKENPLKKISSKTWLMAGGVIVVFIIAFAFLANRKTTVKLNDYVTVSFDGYDTVGTAEAVFDKQAFLNDYGKKIKQTGRDRNEDSVADAESLLQWCTSGWLDKTDQLSNGDTITYQWQCDDSAAEEKYKCKLKYEDIAFTVSELEDVIDFDPFEDIEITFSGVAPDGTAELVNNSEMGVCSELDYQFDRNEKLSNKDEIVVTVTGPWGENITDYCVQQYGMAPVKTEARYTVEGLGKYVTSLAEIPDETLEAMKKQAEDAMIAYAAKNWSEKQKFAGMTYLGSNLLIGKNPEEAYSRGDYNVAYLVYQVNGQDNYADEGIQDAYSYYYFTSFADIITLPDGTCSANLNEYDTPRDSFQREVQYGSKSWEYDTFNYYGYEDLDTLFSKSVTAYVDRYDWESNVEAVTAASTENEESN